MNKKGQTEINIGGLLVAFVGIIVGLALFLAVAQTIGPVTSTTTYNSSVNGAYTSAVSGSKIDLIGQELISVTLVQNATDVLPATNYTTGEHVSTSTGVKSIYFQTDDAEIESATFNITYVYGADGYLDNSGARSIALIIPIFAALAIAVVALVPSLRSGIMDLMKK